MTKTVIHTVLGINNCTLLVFYTQSQCWQFRVISCNGSVYGERKIYYTADAAEAAGREWVVKR
ncbi:hypothetical protein VB797_15040 [Rivularia sp. UHCC 0363]|nr:hypothetical protein [Rivularia sp. UHCC 0363]MEA5595661.1 hypothetical protein [Rivularia sp. UHCC 0363]